MPRHANTEFIELFRGLSIPASGTTMFSKEFTLGEGWVRLHLRFNIVLTNTSGTTPLAEGELRVIRGVSFRTDKGEIICNNAPGRFLYKLAQIKQGTAPVKDAASAIAGTFHVPIDIWFSDPFRMREEEAHMTILDTKRYGSLIMQVTMGSIADFLSVVGDGALAPTLDCYVERFKGLLPRQNQPLLYVNYGVFPPQAPATQQYVDMEKSENLAYKRLHIFTSTGATAGVPYSGTANDAVIGDLDVEQTEKFAMQNTLWDVLQRQGQVDYQLEAIPAGCGLVSFVDKSASHETVLKTGGQSRLRVNWRNGTLPATPQVTVGYEGIRPLIGVR